MAASALESVAQLATQEPPQGRHVVLLALLTQLRGWLSANTSTRFAPSAIERMRVAASRNGIDDPYQLHLALGSGIGRVFFVPRTATDPCSWVDVVGPGGRLFSITRTSGVWSMRANSGATAKLDEAAFVRQLSASLRGLLLGAA